MPWRIGFFSHIDDMEELSPEENLFEAAYDHWSGDSDAAERRILHVIKTAVTEKEINNGEEA